MGGPLVGTFLTESLQLCWSLIRTLDKGHQELAIGVPRRLTRSSLSPPPFYFFILPSFFNASPPLKALERIGKPLSLVWYAGPVSLYLIREIVHCPRKE
ncbi:hypothetical protein NPIL_214921 [Nephila pilipes]|uniref:Uncharacterized protein n=1 Tax=Nephila pilipes TaxID=299642 RepID=A0A8X6TCJ0_NEPPI|nr:hypothetical protein NPIL_214921 [Nephila pilipes]